MLQITIPEKIQGEENLYYARFEMITVNGKVSYTNLIFEPANEEFRIEKFHQVNSTGTSEFSSKTDPLSAAKHHAISNLLQKFGLKSVKSKGSIFNGIINKDEVIIRYEGIIKYPVKITNEGYLENSKTYQIEMEAFFSPVAFPDQWHSLYLKNKLLRKLKDFLSIFISF